MSVHKIYRRDNQPFAQIPNVAIRDPRITTTAFRLLAYLMSHQDGYQIGYEQIERETGLGRYAINEAIKNLTALGWVEVDRPKAANGQFTHKSWTILNPYEEATVGNSTMESHHMGQPTDLRRQPNKEENYKEDILVSQAQDEAFAEFWQAYPRKTDKAPARRAFNRFPPDLWAEIIAGAKRYAADPNLPETQYQKHPKTWLTGEAWTNPPLPERKKSKEEKIADRERENAERLARLLAEEQANEKK